MTKKFQKALAFMLTVIMAMTINLPSGTLGIFNLVKTVKAATTITPIQPSGSGTSGSPYQITNKEELYWFAQQVNGGNTKINAKLMNDITVNSNVLNASGELNKGDFTAWTPIGNESKQYKGTFNGNGKTISGLYFNKYTTDYVGLFGYVGSGGNVSNVGVVASYFKGGYKVGGVCGYNYGTIKNCYNTGAVSGNESVGGVCGYTYWGTIENCYNTGAVSGDYVGGVCGYNEHGTIKKCYNKGAVSGSWNVGGVCGYNRYGTFENCYNTGAVEGSDFVGGVCGYNSDGTIKNCYNTGAVSGYGYVGGVCGENYGGTITNCYYLDTCGATSTLATSMTEIQFASGEVCYKLNNGVTDGTQAWYQIIGTDTLPMFEGDVVDYNGTEYFNVHQWSETPTSTVAPTCTEDGYDVYTCSVCGTTKNDVKTALGHKWSEAPTSTVAPTCTEDGYDVYTCSVCGVTKNVANGTATGHKWGDTPTSTVAPTCTEDGYDVYTCSVCGTTKKDVKTALGHSYDDGICIRCGEFNVVQPKNGDGSTDNPYQIANYGHLMWFQQFVDSGNYSANAVLTADITANKNLLNENGEVSGTPEYTWTPITQSADSSTCYSGVFDGQGHTISGLYAPKSSSDYCALFGTANGTIKNLFITDSYFGGSGCKQAASFVGYGFSNCAIENCGSDAAVVGSMYCGGIAGETKGTIKNCYFAGKINSTNRGTSNAIASERYNNGTLINCYYLDTCGLDSNRATAKTTEKFASGEVCYKLNKGVTDGTQAWYQTLAEDTLPKLNGKTVYYDESADPQYYNKDVIGDLSCDGTTDKADAALVLRYISGIGTLNDYQLTVADANSDGKVDMLDVVEILGLVG